MEGKELELLRTIHRLMNLLEELGEAHWYRWMEKSRDLLVTKSTKAAVDHLLGAYGGMGSFNDLVTGLGGEGEGWQPGAKENNDRLDALRSEAYDLALSFREQGQV